MPCEGHHDAGAGSESSLFHGTMHVNEQQCQALGSLLFQPWHGFLFSPFECNCIFPIMFFRLPV